jgi:hypothetical protein
MIKLSQWSALGGSSCQYGISIRRFGESLFPSAGLIWISYRRHIFMQLRCSSHQLMMTETQNVSENVEHKSLQWHCWFPIKSLWQLHTASKHTLNYRQTKTYFVRYSVFCSEWKRPERTMNNHNSFTHCSKAFQGWPSGLNVFISNVNTAAILESL